MINFSQQKLNNRDKLTLAEVIWMVGTGPATPRCFSRVLLASSLCSSIFLAFFLVSQRNLDFGYGVMFSVSKKLLFVLNGLALLFIFWFFHSSQHKPLVIGPSFGQIIIYNRVS